MTEQLAVGPSGRSRANPTRGGSVDWLRESPEEPSRRPVRPPVGPRLRAWLTELSRAVRVGVRQQGAVAGVVGTGVLAALGLLGCAVAGPALRRGASDLLVVAEGGAGELPVTVPPAALPLLMTGLALLLAGVVVTALACGSAARRRLGTVAAAVVAAMCIVLGVVVLVTGDPFAQLALVDAVLLVAAVAVVPVVAVAWGLTALGLIALVRIRWSWLPRWCGVVLAVLTAVPAWLGDRTAVLVPAGVAPGVLLGAGLGATIGLVAWLARARPGRAVGVPIVLGLLTIAVAASWATLRSAVGAGVAGVAVPSLDPYLAVGRWAGIGVWVATALALLLGLFPGQRPDPRPRVRQSPQPDQQTEPEEQPEQREEPGRETGFAGIEEPVQGPGDRTGGDVDRQVQQRNDDPYRRPVPPEPAPRTDPEPFRRPE